MSNSAERVEVTPSGGNVFADLGLPNADELLVKSRLVIRIRQIIEDRRLTQEEAARLVGIDQPKISALMRGRLAGYSTDRLLGFLQRLGDDVDIVLRPSQEAVGHVQVTIAAG
jgi:predicted XRE-type DNA-binding protein